MEKLCIDKGKRRIHAEIDKLYDLEDDSGIVDDGEEEMAGSSGADSDENQVVGPVTDDELIRWKVSWLDSVQRKQLRHKFTLAESGKLNLEKKPVWQLHFDGNLREGTIGYTIRNQFSELVKVFSGQLKDSKSSKNAVAHALIAGLEDLLSRKVTHVVVCGNSRAIRNVRDAGLRQRLVNLQSQFKVYQIDHLPEDKNLVAHFMSHVNQKTKLVKRFLVQHILELGAIVCLLLSFMNLLLSLEL